MAPDTTALRGLPSVDRLLSTEAAQRLLQAYARAAVVGAIRAELEDARGEAQAGAPAPDAAAVMRRVEARLARESAAPLRPVLNASGVVLHTNLGRADLAPAVRAAMLAAAGTVNLEYDLEAGERGDRDALVEADLCALTGAEAATVVNNNAAAVLLVLNTLAQGREIVVSRGELVEIGGSFRLPDVLRKSGGHLREVGTTNRTYAHDYERAIGPETGVLLKVHTSNYRVVGFTTEVSLDALVAIGREHGLPVVEDLGSGALVDLSAYGLPKEPTVRERIALGADIVTCSGDKLLGGPQAGLIVGRRRFVDAVKQNPLKRALRCDKLTLAALSATLRLYRFSPRLDTELPTLRWLTRPLAEIDAAARAAVRVLGDVLGPDFALEVVPGHSEVGSGALPTETLETRLVAIAHPRLGADAIARRFRAADPPVIGRIHDGRFLLDMRTIDRTADLGSALQMSTSRSAGGGPTASGVRRPRP